MANTFKLNWLLRKLLNSFYSSRKSRQMDESRRIGSHSGTSESNGAGKGPRLPTTRRPARLPRSPNVSAVRLDPQERCLDSSKTANRSLSSVYNRQRREKQLAKSLGSQEGAACSKRSSPIPLKVLEMSQREQRAQVQRNRRMCWQEANDSVTTKSMEKMVRESQARLLNQRVRDLFKEPAADTPKKCQGPAIITHKDKAVEELLKTAIGLEKGGDKDVKISRMQTKLEWDGQRPSSRSADPFGDNLQARHAYHMRIVCFQPKKPSEPRRKTRSDTRSSQARPTSNLVKEEQKRLDILKAEWVQLKGLENSARHIKNSPKGPKKPPDTDAKAPTNLDLKSLIVDPKSFLTKVHVKSKILSVDLCDHFPHDTLVENPDVFPNISKNNKYGVEDEAENSGTNTKEELPKLVPN